MESPSTATSTIIPTTTQVQSSTGRSKHLILILLVVFPPLAWYYMWKEEKYHNWFASVLMIDGLIFLGTSILLLYSVYPPLIKLYDSLNIPNSQLYKLIPYTFIAIGIIEILFAIYLKFQIKKNGALSKGILILTILLLTTHFLGLPLGQIASYLSVATSLYDINNKYYSAIPTPQPRAIPSPTISTNSYWASYSNEYFSIDHPETFKIVNSGILEYGVMDANLTNFTHPGDTKISIGGSGNLNTYLNYNQSITDIKNSLTDVKSSPINNGVLISGEGVNQDNTNTNSEVGKRYYAIFKYKDGAIVFSHQGSTVPTDTYLKMINTLMVKEPAAQVACTMDAKICPDGSSVGRTGPNCEFTACPQ